MAGKTERDIVVMLKSNKEEFEYCNPKSGNGKLMHSLLRRMLWMQSGIGTGTKNIRDPGIST